MDGEDVCADFETTTKIDDCRVWAWGISWIADPTHCEYGTDIESFFRFIASGNITSIWFHNLAFDGKFIVDKLLRLGYKRSCARSPYKGQFTTLMSSSGQFYSLSICFHNRHSVTIKDSLKVLPMSVKAIAKAFALPETKGEIDYKAERPVGHVLTDEERDYLSRDIIICAKAMSHMYAESLTRMTLASDAFSFYKGMCPTFEKLFPVIETTMDEVIRHAYRGGFTYCAPEYADLDVGPGISVDRNSMYPTELRYAVLPFGVPKIFEGKGSPTDEYPLFVQTLTCTFELKAGAIPCIQLQGGMYMPHEYATQTLAPVTITVTNVDLEIIEQSYDIDILSYDGGVAFHGRVGNFNDYVDYWMSRKMKDKDGKRAIDKFMLNMLYGKFATSTDTTTKGPEMIKDVVHWKQDDPSTRDPIYTALAVFVTAWARHDLFHAIWDNRERFLYCDTDSMHLLGTEQPKGIEIHDSKLGAWKVEGTFSRARHIRAKTYMWDLNDEIGVKCAGMPANVKELVTWDNFHRGFTNIVHGADGDYIRPGYGKLRPLAVPGGIVLIDGPFTIS